MRSFGWKLKHVVIVSNLSVNTVFHQSSKLTIYKVTLIIYKTFVYSELSNDLD
jgi:hypothetical protein